MKNNIYILALSITCLITACNNKKTEMDSSIEPGNDSSLMNKNTIDTNSTTKIIINDSTKNLSNIVVNNDSTAVTAGIKKIPVVKADTIKRLKKGRISLGTYASNNNVALIADKEGFYKNTEVRPSFSGGEKSLENFFESNIQYPEEASENNAEGTVLLNFAVDEKGKIYAPKVISNTIGYGIEKEALRVFNKMPAWLPGSIKGKNVKTRYTLPIKFKLDN